jgi:phosphatidate cytidylyltransferase
MKIEPNEIVTVGGVLVILTARFFFQEAAVAVFVATVFIAMAAHLFAYERGHDNAAVDFGITVTGLVYMGWIGAYILDLRYIVDKELGLWWFFLVLPLVWAADTGAYSIGVTYGKHKMAPRLSPKKSWEGYFGGIFTSVIVGAFFAYAFSSMGPQPLHDLVNPLQGAMLGLLIGALAPLGDFGESMIKRQSGLKDSSNFIPGHGGFLDRIDSWIWGAAIGYFLIHYFIL